MHFEREITSISGQNWKSESEKDIILTFTQMFARLLFALTGKSEIMFTLLHNDCRII